MEEYKNGVSFADRGRTLPPLPTDTPVAAPAAVEPVEEDNDDDNEEEDDE